VLRYFPDAAAADALGVPVAVLVLLDPQPDLGLPFLQFARLFVVVALRNPALRPTELPLSGAANVWLPSPLCELLSPRRNTCRVSNSLSGFVPDLQASAGRYADRRAFDSGR